VADLWTAFFWSVCLCIYLFIIYLFLVCCCCCRPVFILGGRGAEEMGWGFQWNVKLVSAQIWGLQLFFELGFIRNLDFFRCS
jgi:hypothetical protein